MKEVKLYVSSRYHKFISDQMDELSALFPPDVPFLLFVNEDLSDTECYIESNHGRVVVSIDEQLMELRNQLVELLESVE
jgi:flagellar assembly protein FliH